MKDVFIATFAIAIVLGCVLLAYNLKEPEDQTFYSGDRVIHVSYPKGGKGAGGFASVNDDGSCNVQLMQPNLYIVAHEVAHCVVDFWELDGELGAYYQGVFTQMIHRN